MCAHLHADLLGNARNGNMSVPLLTKWREMWNTYSSSPTFCCISSAFFETHRISRFSSFSLPPKLKTWNSSNAFQYKKMLWLQNIKKNKMGGKGLQAEVLCKALMSQRYRISLLKSSSQGLGRCRQKDTLETKLEETWNQTLCWIFLEKKKEKENS